MTKSSPSPSLKEQKSPTLEPSPCQEPIGDVDLENKTPPKQISVLKCTADKTTASKLTTTGRRLRLGSTTKKDSAIRHEYLDCRMRSNSACLELGSCLDDKFKGGCERWDGGITAKIEVLKTFILSLLHDSAKKPVLRSLVIFCNVHIYQFVLILVSCCFNLIASHIFV